MSAPLLSTLQLGKDYPHKQGTVVAVNDVSLEVHRGETLGIVGESGSGKSTLARLMLNLLRPSRGKVVFDNREIQNLTDAQMRPLRRKMQMIFQDPYASLNPRMTVRQILSEPLIIHKLCATQAERDQSVAQLLSWVGLPKDASGYYPHEFSGGQRQRIGIARAIAVRPELIICDEAVSALDVSIQANILNLLLDLQQEMHLAFVFISHDLKVVQKMSKNVAVMQAGRVIELGSSDSVFNAPQMPYTRQLLHAVLPRHPLAQ